MSNYVASGRPGIGTFNLSQPMRDEFTAIQEAIATKSDLGGLSATSITSLTIGDIEQTLTVARAKFCAPVNELVDKVTPEVFDTPITHEDSVPDPLWL